MTLERGRGFLATTMWILLWLYLYLMAVLGGWVMVAWVATGWQPTTVTSGSMAPAVRAGDVVFYEDAEPGQIAQRTIVLFEDSEGNQVLHRVFEVTENGYVTKGDANTDPDTEMIGEGQVLGVGRLIVPYVGLPVVWWAEGNTVVVVAWLILTVGSAALGLMRTTGWRAFQRSARRPGSAITQKAVRQVRALVGVMIFSQFLIDSSRFEVVSTTSVSPAMVLVAALAVLVATNAISIRSSKSPSHGAVERWSLVELALDTALVIGLTTATGTNGIGWVLFALPIIEAAARFRLAGALTHWMVLTGVTVAARVAIGARQLEASTELLGDLDQLLEQLSVLLLVVIPGAYLAEQLVTDVLLQRKATGAAQHRSQVLHQVVELGQEVTHLDRNLFDTLTKGMLTLGIEGADVVVAQPGGQWTVLSSAFKEEGGWLPDPGAPGSGLRAEDLNESSVLIDREDPNLEDRAALAASPWTSLVRLAIEGPQRSTIAVRAATTGGLPLDPEVVDALQLLLGQATVGIKNNQLIDELRTLNDRIQTQATQDDLTGLPNRRLLLSVIEETLADLTEQREDLDQDDIPTTYPSLLFLDLNGFKPINDRFGHEAGDELLMAVAGRLAKSVEGHGMVARIGGDEFTVLLHGRDEGHGLVGPIQIAELLADSVSQPFAIERGRVTVTSAIGIAELVDDDQLPLDAEETIRRADVAMYRAKTDPSVRWVHYEPAMDEAARRAAELAPYLADAIENNELALHFQPLVTADTRRLAGVEALLRWTSTEFGQIRPDEIVQIAETNGLADDLNQWIVEHATARVADWQRRFDAADLFLTVNASPAELQSRQLASNVSRALLLSGLDPATLIVELSERLTTEQDHDMLRSLDELAALGIRVVLDDFGQGQTSLAHLRQLPLVGIKLDRQLVVQAAERADDLVILSSMVGLAHDLNLRVVAEGVETEHQFKVVADAGVDLVQGYLVGRPVEAAVIANEFFAGYLEMAEAGPLSPNEEPR